MVVSISLEAGVGRHSTKRNKHDNRGHVNSWKDQALMAIALRTHCNLLVNDSCDRSSNSKVYTHQGDLIGMTLETKISDNLGQVARIHKMICLVFLQMKRTSF